MSQQGASPGGPGDPAQAPAHAEEGEEAGEEARERGRGEQRAGERCGDDGDGVGVDCRVERAAVPAPCAEKRRSKADIIEWRRSGEKERLDKEEGERTKKGPFSSIERRKATSQKRSDGRRSMHETGPSGEEPLLLASRSFFHARWV